MAEQVSIPAGVNPASAIPSDASVVQRGGAAPTPGGLPAIPGSNEQTPGFVVPPAGPAAGSQSGDAAEFEAFLEWKKAKTGTQTPAPKPTPAAPAASKHTPGFEGVGAEGALSATKQAAQADAYVMSIFSTFEMVAPELDLARAVGTALDRGDASLIDVKYITEKAGDKAGKLIDVAKGLVTHVTATVDRLTADIYASAGGEDKWNAAVEAFNAKAPKYMKELVAQGVDSANPERIKSAVESMLGFVKDNGGLPVDPQGHIRAGGGAAAAGVGLSKQEYQEERLKLDRRARDFPERERELTARRQIGKSQGK